jgi:hypothetical protein
MSKKKKGKGTCYCGEKIRPGSTECPRCHRVTAAGVNDRLRKAVMERAGVTFIGKAQRPRCPASARAHDCRSGARP